MTTADNKNLSVTSVVLSRCVFEMSTFVRNIIPLLTLDMTILLKFPVAEQMKTNRLMQTF